MSYIREAIIPHKGKETFVLWSGGLDSTYMIQHLLNDDPTRVVTAGYVELINNVEKTKMEKNAIKTMEKIFKDKYHDRFTYIGPVYRAEVISVGKWMCLVQMPLWMSAIMSSTPKQIDEVCIGYVMNDCAISYLSEFQGVIKAYKKLCDGRFPKVLFPLSKFCKEDMVGWLDYNLKEHVVWCEYPRLENEKWIPCGTCVPCEHSPIMRSLYGKGGIPIPAKKEEFVETFNKEKVWIQTNFDFFYQIDCNKKTCSDVVQVKSSKSDDVYDEAEECLTGCLKALEKDEEESQIVKNK